MKPFAVTLLLCAALASAKELPPPGGSPKPFRLPAAQDFTLPNGMKVTIVPFGEVPRLAVRVFIDAGQIYEPGGQTGIARLTALLMKEGTATRTAGQVATEAAGMGGQVEINVATEYMTAGGVVLSDFGPRFISLLADVLENPLLPDSEMARLKNNLVRDLAVERSQPQNQAREHFLKLLFPNQPYGRAYPAPGELEHCTRTQVKAFYGAFCDAGRAHLYVAGKIGPGLRPAIERAFSKWARGTAPDIPPAKPSTTRAFALIDRPNAPQSTLFLGLAVAKPGSPDYMPLVVMDSLLGGSFASRITSNIREQKGYTYSPFSQVATRHHMAFWLESADVTTNVTGPSLKEIFYEINRLRSAPPSEAELKGIQNYLAGTFVIRNTASADAVINQLQFVDSQDLPRSFLTDYVPRVMAVTPDEVQRIAQKYILPDKMTLVVVGDKAKIADQIKPYETTP
jgi:zinc protease